MCSGVVRGLSIATAPMKDFIVFYLSQKKKKKTVFGYNIYTIITYRMANYRVGQKLCHYFGG